MSESRIGFDPNRSPEETIGPGFISIHELANRWRCSRGTVYNRLRVEGAQVLDFAAPGKRGRKVIPIAVVFLMEERNMKRLC